MEWKKIKQQENDRFALEINESQLKGKCKGKRYYGIVRFRQTSDREIETINGITPEFKRNKKSRKSLFWRPVNIIIRNQFHEELRFHWTQFRMGYEVNLGSYEEFTESYEHTFNFFNNSKKLPDEFSLIMRFKPREIAFFDGEKTLFTEFVYLPTQKEIKVIGKLLGKE